jgi:hypothetical protein
MEFIKFIFSSFWIWLGALVLLSVVCQTLVSIIEIIVFKKDPCKEKDEEENEDNKINIQID